MFDENAEGRESDMEAAEENISSGSLAEASSPSPAEANSRRNWRPLVRMRDYATGEDLYEQDNEAHLAISTTTDPVNFEDALKSEKWRQAMDLEMEAINKNDTWELMELPEGRKKVGVKWIYKTKFNENGKVDKYKATLEQKFNENGICGATLWICAKGT